MTAVKKRLKKPRLLSHTRPPTARAKNPKLSAKATRNLIRSHHRLLKSRAQALKAGNEDLVREIDGRIQANGGLESYQLASKLGQSLERGGDSSKVLVDWIAPSLAQLKNSPYKLRMLEVGALSTENACSKNQYLDVTRIDLNAQEPGILKQDFMERPLPRADDDRFHIISLSLVLNYVPNATGRGDMLKRCVEFLTDTPPAGSITIRPSLFLVLPLACVKNSRYLTSSRLQEILSSMGFTLAKNKETSKLIFQLWEHDRRGRPRPFKKEILNPGKTRNNFAINVQ
jgi:25S rRNA (adenine2142-N1)-methyltransferase